VPLPEKKKLCVAGKLQFFSLVARKLVQDVFFFLPKVLERKDDELVRVWLEYIWPSGDNDLMVQERFLMMMIWERHLLIQ
jgi:hypothetical protein